MSQRIIVGEWIGVDLDRTLAQFPTNHNFDCPPPWVIGPPVPRMVQRVKQWISDGKTVKIFTARVANIGGAALEREIGNIQAYCLEHIGTHLEVTCKKDMYMVEFWDDRAVQVIPNTGQTILDRLLAPENRQN